MNPGSPTMSLGVSDPLGDDPNNNLFTVTFNCLVQSGLNHCNDFEDPAVAPWFVDPESINPSFNLSPNSSNLVINTPPSGGGSQFWGTTGPDGTYNSNEQSSIVSPFFSFAGIENLVVAFDLFYQMETDWDGAVMQYSVDGGQTWLVLGSQGSGTNWYNHGAVNGPGAGGQNSEHWNGLLVNWLNTAWSDLDQLSGMENVLFRLSIGVDDVFQDAGLGFDNVCISGETIAVVDTPDIVINEFNYTDIDGDILDFVELKNVGTTTVNMAELQLSFFDLTGTVGSSPYMEILGTAMSGSLQPGEYYVIGASGGVPNQDLSVFSPTGVNIITDSASIVLSHTGFGFITLDAVGYGEGIVAGPFGFLEGVAIDDHDNNDLVSTDLGYSRFPGGLDTDNNNSDFSLRCVTPGTTNSTNDFCLNADSIDVAIINLEQLGPCGGGFSSPVRVTIKNLGYQPQLISEVEDGLGNIYPLIPPISLDYLDSTSVVVDLLLVNPGTYDVSVTVNLTNDANTFDNTYTTQFNCMVVNALNHTNDFENQNNAPWWTYTAGENSSWVKGDNSSNVTINTPPPSGGTISWTTTNGNGTYNESENSSIISPYFDFSNVQNSGVRFDLWIDAETDKDGAVFEYSLDGGVIWEAIGSIASGFNWYNTGPLPNGGAGDQNDAHWSGDGTSGTLGWSPTSHVTDILDGLQNVLLRLAFRSDTTVVDEGGIGFDNFEIYIEAPEPPNIVINEFNYVDFDGEEFDFVELKNTDTVDIDLSEFRLNFIRQVNGLITTYQTIAAPDLGGILGPGEYYLIGDTSGLLFPDIEIFDGSGGVVGDTAAIELFHDPSGSRADVVCYGDNISGYVEVQAITFVDPGNQLYRESGFSRIPDDFDSDNNIEDFRFRCITPGFANEPNDSVCFTPDLVINEFNYADPSGEAFDFIELKNNSADTLDLGLFELSFYDENGIPAGLITLPLTGSLDPNDYYVIGAPSGVPNQDFTLNPAADYLLGPNGSILLEYVPNINTADIVGYGGPVIAVAEGAPISEVDSAMFLEYTVGFARSPDGFDGNNNNLDFRPECHTPGEPNGLDSICVGLVMVNEVDRIGATGDSVFVELYNRTPILADLNGFILEFDDATNLDSIILDGSIGNMDYRVFSIPSAGFDPEHVTIMLQDTQSATIVDRLTIAQTPVGLPNTEGEFTTPDASIDLSISRFPNGQDTDDNGNDFSLLCATLGSENFNTTINCGPVGIGEELEFRIKLYPNPAKDLLTLETGSSETFNIQILDAMGRVSKTTNISD